MFFITYVNDERPRKIRNLTWKDNAVTDEVDHEVVQYVDDSSNIMSADHDMAMKQYAKHYMCLLIKCYESNRLLINESDMTFMIVSGPINKSRKVAFKIEINDNANIEKELSIEILGWRMAPEAHKQHPNKMKSPIIEKLAEYN